MDLPVFLQWIGRCSHLPRVREIVNNEQRKVQLYGYSKTNKLTKKQQMNKEKQNPREYNLYNL